MADIEALDTNFTPRLRLKCQQLLQRLKPARLSGLHIFTRKNRQPGILLGHFNPDFLHRVPRLDDWHRTLGQFCQCKRKVLIRHSDVQINPARYRMHRVVLANKSREHFGWREITRITRELGLVAKMPAAAHHRQIDAKHAVLTDHDDHIDIFAFAAFYILLVLHASQ